MDKRAFAKQFAVQFVGQALLLAVVWYWLKLGVGTTAQVAVNAALGLAIIAGWSLLDAYGLGNWKNWLWAFPTAASVVFLGFKFAAPLIALLWLLVLLPSAAVGRLKLLAGPQYLLVGFGLLIAMSIVPYALLGWVPKLEGLNPQLASFGGRAALAYTIAVAGWAALLAYVGRNARQSSEQQST